MLSFGNEELRRKPFAKTGQTVRCPHCQGEHVLQASKDTKTGKEGSLHFYKCGEKLFLGGVDGRLVVGDTK